MPTGLAKHSQKINTFIFSQDIDILLVSETYFTNKNYCRIFGYTLYHTMHHEGTILISLINYIKHYEIGGLQKEFLHAACNIMVVDRNGCLAILASYSPEP